jgi:catechol 2,3-dioxygenase-like lactoylglutathione lyase family enzyme
MGDTDISHSRIVRRKGPIRDAFIAGEPQPVVFSVHGGIAQHYGVKIEEQTGDRKLMIDHLSLGATNLARSVAFYRDLFAPLGYALQNADEKEASFGPGSDRTFFLYPACDRVAVTGMHVAFAAKSSEAVDKAFFAATSAGATVAREPSNRPEISAAYYGCVVLDPDGHRLEIVRG